MRRIHRRGYVAIWLGVLGLLLASLPGGSTTAQPAATPTPLIFTHGILGSRLEEVGGGELWPGLPQLNKDRLSLAPGEEREVVATDVIRDILPGFDLGTIYTPLLEMLTDPAQGGYVEYEVANDPGRRTTAGCDLSQGQPTLFVFAYDWRKSNAENAELLADYVGCIKRIHGADTSVNILAHSMGSLLVRRYILAYPDDHSVARLITIGAPWLGAPKAAHSLLTGEQSFPITPVLIRPAVLKDLVEYYPSAHELLPSATYFTLSDYQLDDPYVFSEDGWDIDGDNRATEVYTPNEFVSFVDGEVAGSNPGSANTQFHAGAQDDWREDTSGVQYYHLYGIQPIAATVGGVRATTTTSCRLLLCDTEEILQLELVQGDGTVPTLSATRIGGGAYLNAPGTRLKSFVSADAAAVEHTELTKNSAVHTYILAALRSSQLLQQDEIGPQAVEKAYYITLTGTASMTVTDSIGNSVRPVDPASGLEPALTYYGLGEQAHMLVLPADQPYTVTWEGGAAAMSVDVVLGTGDDTIQAVRFRDLALPTPGGVQLRLEPYATAQSQEPAQNAALRYDQDDDGTFEATLEATAAVGDAAARDVEPPVITLDAAKTGTTTTVTLTAEDRGTGVAQVLYSLDGTTYQPYTDPFQVDPAQTPIIYAFADDAVANRSSRLVYDLTARTSVYLPLIAR